MIGRGDVIGHIEKSTFQVSSTALILKWADMDSYVLEEPTV